VRSRLASKGDCEQRFDQAVDTYTRTTHEREAEGWASVLHPDVAVVFAVAMC
jgi:hypothetical protein